MAEHRVGSRLLWLNSYMSDFVSQPTEPRRASFRCIRLSKSPFARLSAWQICHVRQFETVMLSSMDAVMTCLTDRDLFPIEHPKDTVKACRLPLVGELSDMSDVVHFNLHLVHRVATNATWFGKT